MGLPTNFRELAPVLASGRPGCLERRITLWP
jgi:hypothetical protein